MSNVDLNNRSKLRKSAYLKLFEIVSFCPLSFPKWKQNIWTLSQLKNLMNLSGSEYRLEIDAQCISLGQSWTQSKNVPARPPTCQHAGPPPRDCTCMRNVYLRIAAETPTDDWSFGDNWLWICSSRLLSWWNDKEQISLLCSKTTTLGWLV